MRWFVIIIMRLSLSNALKWFFNKFLSVNVARRKKEKTTHWKIIFGDFFFPLLKFYNRNYWKWYVFGCFIYMVWKRFLLQLSRLKVMLVYPKDKMRGERSLTCSGWRFELDNIFQMQSSGSNASVFLEKPTHSCRLFPIKAIPKSRLPIFYCLQIGKKKHSFTGFGCQQVGVFSSERRRSWCCHTGLNRHAATPGSDTERSEVLGGDRWVSLT